MLPSARRNIESQKNDQRSADPNTRGARALTTFRRQNRGEVEMATGLLSLVLARNKERPQWADLLDAWEITEPLAKAAVLEHRY